MKDSSWKKKLWSLRHFFVAGGIVFFCMVIALLVYLLKVQGQGSKSLRIAWNDNFELVTAPVQEELVQEFDYDLNLYSLMVKFQFDTQPQGALELVMEDAATGETLATGSVDMSLFISGEYTTIGFTSSLPQAEGRRCRLILRPHYEGEGQISLMYSATTPEGSTLSVDGQALDGALAMQINYHQIGSFLTRFYWGICICLSLMAGGAYLYCRSRFFKLHIFVLAAVILLGGVYNTVLPPYSAPDEQFHINQSFSIASVWANRFAPEGIWKMNSVPLNETRRRPSDQNALVQVEETTVFQWSTIAEHLTDRTQDNYYDQQLYLEYQVDNTNTLYYLTGGVVFLCYLLKLGFVPTLLLGRLANLILFALCASWAVKRIPVGKNILTVVALLPMTLHLAASFSRDSVIMSLSLVYLAMVLAGCLDENFRFRWYHWVIAALIAYALIPAKYVYIPLVLTILVLPAKKLGKRPRLARVGLAVYMLAVLLGRSVIAPALENYLYLLSTPYDTYEEAMEADEYYSQNPELLETAPGQTSLEEELALQESTESSDSSAEATGEETVNPDSICYSFSYILSHPVDTFLLGVNSIIELGDHYVRTLVGGSLSYYNLDLAWTWVLLLYALLFFAALPVSGEAGLPFTLRLVLGGAALLCAGFAVGGCVLWTPTYYTTIYGFQGRYLLPALPAALLALSPVRLKYAGDLRPGLACATVWINAGVLLNAMLVIIAR